jgi:Putative prokaryotic signal transducing protein
VVIGCGVVTVQICSSLPDAQVVQSCLKGSGIEAFLPDEMTIQNNWLWANAMGGVRVQVFDEDAERAAEILRESDEEPATPTEPQP